MEARTERLAAVGRLWGDIRLFHPEIPTGRVDWDTALVDALPDLLAATDDAGYRAGVTRLLAHLGDPATLLLPETSDPPRSSASEGTAGDFGVRWTTGAVGRVGVVAARDARSLDRFAIDDAFTGIFADLADADGIILDLREADYLFAFLVRDHLPDLIEGDIDLPAVRTRMHVGHVPEDGGSDMYHSAFVVADSRRVRGRGGPLAAKPLAVILDPGNSLEVDVLGLRSHGRAGVVWCGEFRGTGPTERVTLPGGLVVEYRTGDLLAPDGSTGIRPDRTLEVGAGDAHEVAVELLALGPATTADVTPDPAPVGRRPKSSIDRSIEYPPTAERLLGLFHYWNTIRHHFAYLDLMDRSWDEVLLEYLPRIEAATDATEYSLEMAACNANLGDTHGYFWSPAFMRWLGSHTVPVRVRTIDGDSIVTQAGSGAGGLSVGDVIVALDGEAIAARRLRLARYVAASTPQALEGRLDLAMLRGAERSVAELDVVDAQGAFRTVQAIRSVANAPLPQRPYPVYELRPDGYGYMDLHRLTVRQVDEALEAVRRAPALILDMRGYPNGTAWTLAPRLARGTPVAAQFRKPIPRHPGDDFTTVEQMFQRVPPTDGWRYEGRVVMLIDADAISQSEHTCLFVEAATEGEVIFIGTPTNGANGDITSVALPGGIGVNFSGHDIRHGDGRQLQRLGIQPHVHAAPTIAGIRAGRDEVLEAALGHLASLS